MVHVITRFGYTGRQFLDENGRWTSIKDEALAFYRRETAEQFAAIASQQTGAHYKVVPVRR